MSEDKEKFAEKREATRINLHKEKLAAMAHIHHDANIPSLKFHLTTLENVVINEKWEEFITTAAQIKADSIRKHKELLILKEKAYADAMLKQREGIQ